MAAAYECSLALVIVDFICSSLKNKAFIGLGSCDNVQIERIIFEYENWPRLQIKRNGLSSWSVQLVRPAGPSKWSVQLVCPAGPSSWSVQRVVQLVQLADPFTHCILHIPSYTMHLAHCFLHIVS